MIDYIIKQIKDGLLAEMGKSTPLYTKHIITNIIEKNIDNTTPSYTIGIVEGESMPMQYHISSGISPVTEMYNIQLQVMIRAASDQQAKEIRRILVGRVKRALFLKDSEVGSRLLGATVNEERYTEVVKKYQIVRTNYDNNQIEGDYIYIALIDMIVETDSNYS